MDMPRYVFKLYITGDRPHSAAAVKNMRTVCETYLKGEYELTVINILDRPQIAEDKKIMATPLLVNECPLPEKRLIGDLSNQAKVLEYLGIKRS